MSNFKKKKVEENSEDDTAMSMAEGQLHSVNEDAASHCTSGEPSEHSVKPCPSVPSCCCRICHQDEKAECLISPCFCKGTHAYIHRSCLEHWLNVFGRDYCEVCNFRYNVVMTPRYGMFRALQIWLQHPRIRRGLREDALIILLMTLFTFGLFIICMIGFQYYTSSNKDKNVTKFWLGGAFGFLLCLITLGYCMSLCLLLKTHLKPWFRWWRSTVNVQLVLHSCAHPSLSTIHKPNCPNSMFESLH